MNGEFLTVREAIAELGIGINAFDAMVENGDIKIVRYRERGRRRVPVTEIARLKSAMVKGQPADRLIGRLVREHINVIEMALLTLANHPYIADFTNMNPGAVAELASQLREIVGD